MTCPPGRVVFALLLWGFLSHSVSGAAGDGPAAKFKHIQATIQNQELTVTIEMEGPFHYQIIGADSSPSLTLECSPLEKLKAPVSKEIRAFQVEKIRVIEGEEGVARIVFEFSEKAPFYLVSQTKIGLQVVFWSREALPPTPAEPASPSKRLNPPAPKEPTTLLGLNLANTTLSDKRFKTVFGYQSVSAWSLELSQVFWMSGQSTLALSFEYKSFSLQGHSTVTGQETSVTITPLPLSVWFLYRLGQASAFISAGPVFVNYREKSILQDTFGYTTGLRLQGGIILGTPTFQAIKAKIFVGWTRALAEENARRLNLGGLEVGAGLALAFSLF